MSTELVGNIPFGSVFSANGFNWMRLKTDNFKKLNPGLCLCAKLKTGEIYYFRPQEQVRPHLVEEQ